MAGWLASQLWQPWLFPSLTAIAVAAFGAHYALRSNIRAKSWQAVYESKRENILKLVRSIDDFSRLASAAMSIVAARNEGDTERYARILKTMRLIFGGSPPNPHDPVQQQLYALMDHTAKDFDKTLKLRVAAASRIITNLLDHKMQEVHWEFIRVADVVYMEARNPLAVAALMRLHTNMYEAINKSVVAQDEAQATSANDEWKRFLPFIMDQLRVDLQKSSRSLQAATRTQFQYRWAVFRASVRELRKEAQKTRPAPAQKD